MFTPTNYVEDPISLMDPYSSLLSPNLWYYEIDGYIPNCYYHDNESQLMSTVGESIAEPIASASSKGDMNGTVDQDSKDGSIKQLVSSRRTGSKADRHSKIATAQGLRDRRMRLSLEVARQFFKLQDMLSYDKPSETMKWLLLQAKPAIEELKQTPPGSFSDATAPSTTPQMQDDDHQLVVVELSKEKEPKQTRKSTSHAIFKPVAKQLRNKARERARKRTQHKKNQLISMQLNIVDPAAGRYLNYLHQCHESPKFQTGDHSIACHTPNLRPSLDVLYKIRHDATNIPFGTPNDFTNTSLVLTANCSQLMNLNYHQQDQAFQSKPIQEFQFQGAPWESYSYQHV